MITTILLVALAVAYVVLKTINTRARFAEADAKRAAEEERRRLEEEEEEEEEQMRAEAIDVEAEVETFEEAGAEDDGASGAEEA